MPRHPTVGMPEEPTEAVLRRIVKHLIDTNKDTSPAEAIASLPPEDRDIWLSSLRDEEARLLEYDWNFFARPKQRFPKGDWKIWVITCGRGWGKTRVGAEWVRDQIESGRCRHIALIGANAKDLRRVIVEDVRGGGSGLMQICPPWNPPHYEPSKMRLTWNNPNYKSYGASCSLYSAEEPDSLRGPAHDGAWLDEFAKYERAQEVWDQLQFGIRNADRTPILITTTPQPVPAFLSILRMEGVVITHGSTFENQANLGKDFISGILDKYEGTRLGRQELFAELLTDVPGALWTMDLIDAAMANRHQDLPDLKIRALGVDPQMSASGMTGIIAAGVSAANPGRNRPALGWVLGDRSMSGTPNQWAKAIRDAYYEFGCHLVLAERNQGGELVSSNIHNVDPTIRIKLVTSTRSKGERAIPVVGRYEQNRVFHYGNFPELVSEMLTFVPGDELRKRSPNRVDALVHVMDYLLVARMRAGAGLAITRKIR